MSFRLCSVPYSAACGPCGIFCCWGCALRPSRGQKPSKSFPQRSGEVKAVQVHYLGPRRREVFHKLLLRVRARIDFREGAQLLVRAEDQVDTRAGPIDLVRFPIAPLVHAFRASRRLPLRAHVEQVDEEVVRRVSGRLVKAPCADSPVFVFCTRRPPTRTVISGAVSVSNCA